jgi:hypothetical protein
MGAEEADDDAAAEGEGRENGVATASAAAVATEGWKGCCGAKVNCVMAEAVRAA